MLYFASLAALGLLGMLALAGGSASADDKTKPVVVLETNLGDISIELDREKAPKSVDNFLKYVDDGFYKGTIFHRVIPDFMIQGGGFPEGAKSQADQKKAGSPVQNEAGNGLKNRRGTIAMARTSDPHSATAQFFINLKDNGFLDRENAQDGFGYTVFGKVVEGMDVVDKMAAVSTAQTRLSEGTPNKEIVIKNAKRKDK
jgi:cyclophilin family peptidyl-prolyl cis-trans isomerase